MFESHALPSLVLMIFAACVPGTVLGQAIPQGWPPPQVSPGLPQVHPVYETADPSFAAMPQQFGQIVQAQHPLLDGKPSQVPPHPSLDQRWRQADFYPPIPTANMQPPFNFSVMPYYSDLGYDASLKDHGHMWGLYSFLSHEKHEFEIAAEYLDISFKDGSAVTQTDLVGAWSYYLGDACKTRLGAHVIDSSDDLSDNGWVLFAGMSQYETGRWEAGLQMYVSHYEDYAPVVTLYQFTPKVALTFAEFNDTTFGGEAYAYYIYSDEEIGLGQQSFWSAEGRLYLTRDPVTVMLYGWAGQQTFAVRNDGFILYNLNELHEGGYGAEMRLKLDHMTEFRVRMGVEHFEDFATRVSAIQRTINVYCLLTF
ncbi:MAG: hypothetical protein O3A00_05425 [Planctomycetota bacterium]|nr:hypothetical protein [Planctomycetota bacterium]